MNDYDEAHTPIGAIKFCSTIVPAREIPMFSSHRRLTRRTLTRVAGALAGIAVVGRYPLAYAQAKGTPAADSSAEFATIGGVVTNTETGDPLADVYVAVGWQSVQRVGISDEEGRYAVDNIPAWEEVDLLGFREGGFRYYNSRYDADTLFVLEPARPCPTTSP